MGTYTYDANGNETSRSVSRLTASGTRTETVTRLYDAENRLIEETDALGAKRRSTYNAAGKLETQTDSQGRVTRYTYDANARLVKTEYPEGSGVATETIEYDAEGNETARTDRAGRITRMSYDALNRLAATTHPDGSTETTEYDAAGRVAATVDRLGRRTTFEYDDAGRQTASTDASGVRTTQAYDANGNRTRLTVDGRTTAYEYDALNRLTRTTWPDGSTHTTAWRPDNRKQSETDARGLTTTYGWDAAGRLASVTQSGVAGTTTYAYDQTGAKTTQLDALGRATTWAHDAAGRVLSRTIQDGSTERHSYDSEGNRLAHKTFAGEDIAYQYDSANRVSGEVIPRAASGAEGGATSYTYSATGNLLTQQESGANSLQGTQTHRYDANDRLVELNNPLGQLRYGWDAAGQITERSVQGSASAAAVPAGTVRYEHDAAGRLLKVTATDGKQARYRYDAAGRLITTERDLNPKDGQAQLLITHHRHDAADRLVAVAEVLRAGAAPQATDTLLAGQALSRGAGGAISRIETYRAGASYDSQAGIFSGTPASTQAFEYDGNARLTRETRTVGSGAAAAITDTRYEYDAAGNRTTKTVTTAAGTEITTYSYDAADRLTSESTSLPAGGSRVVTYTWDANGDLASKTEPGRVTLYRFDARNRLIDIRSGPTNAEASAASPSVSYGYDAQGNRIRKATSQGATSYLIDSTFQYAQLAREITAAAGQGAAGASTATDYVRGLQLVRQRRSDGEPSADLFPLHGHLGTSLGAVDANGAVVEVVDADAFGNLAQPTGLK